MFEGAGVDIKKGVCEFVFFLNKIFRSYLIVNANALISIFRLQAQAINRTYDCNHPVWRVR